MTESADRRSSGSSAPTAEAVRHATTQARALPEGRRTRLQGRGCTRLARAGSSLSGPSGVPWTTAAPGERSTTPQPARPAVSARPAQPAARPARPQGGRRGGAARVPCRAARPAWRCFLRARREPPSLRLWSSPRCACPRACEASPSAARPWATVAARRHQTHCPAGCPSAASLRGCPHTRPRWAESRPPTRRSSRRPAGACALAATAR